MSAEVEGSRSPGSKTLSMSTGRIRRFGEQKKKMQIRIAPLLRPQPRSRSFDFAHAQELLSRHRRRSRMVRLLTQNLIACPAKTCSFPSNFPLTFTDVEKVEIIETEFNEEFLRGYLNRIEWNALRKSAAEVRCREKRGLEDRG